MYVLKMNYTSNVNIFGLKMMVQQYLELGSQVSPENVAQLKITLLKVSVIYCSVTYKKNTLCKVTDTYIRVPTNITLLKLCTFS